MSERTNEWNKSPEDVKEREWELGGFKALPNLQFNVFSWLVIAEIRSAKKEPTRETVGSDSSGSVFVSKDLVEGERSSLFSALRVRKKEKPFWHPPTQKIFVLTMEIEERNRPLGTSILKPFWKGKAQKRIQKGRDWQMDLCRIQTPDVPAQAVLPHWGVGQITFSCHMAQTSSHSQPTSHLLSRRWNPGFIETSRCCTHPCSKHAKPLPSPRPPG